MLKGEKGSAEVFTKEEGELIEHTVVRVFVTFNRKLLNKRVQQIVSDWEQRHTTDAAS